VVYLLRVADLLRDRRINREERRQLEMKWIAVVLIVLSLASLDLYAGDKKYNSKGAGQSKRPNQTALEQQAYTNWLQQGCPSFIAPRYNIQNESREPSQRPLPTWGREGVSGVTKGRN
jgi:hypothetical protein